MPGDTCFEFYVIPWYMSAYWVSTPAKKDEDRKEAKRRKKLNEKRLAGDRFLEFASKRHPEHPAYANYTLKKLKIQNHKMKHETPEEKHGFNSPTPTPKEKENIKN